MNLRDFINRAKDIITEPQKTFVKIALEEKKAMSIFLEYTLPFLIIYSVASYLGRIVFSPATFNIGTDVILKSIVLIIVVLVLGIYLASLALNELLPVFHAKKSRTKMYALVTYSLTPAFLALSLSGLIPKLSGLLNLIGFYAIILFWVSAAALLDMTKERRQIFVPLSVLAVVLVFLFVRIILGAIFAL